MSGDEQGHTGEVVVETPQWEVTYMGESDDTIRRAERARIGSLLERDAETIAGFASDATSAVRLVAFLIQLDRSPEAS